MSNAKVFIAGLLVGLIGIVSWPVLSQSSRNAVQIVQLTGDASAAWIATDDSRLYYCRWPTTDPSRSDVRANCRELDQFRVNLVR